MRKPPNETDAGIAKSVRVERSRGTRSSASETSASAPLGGAPRLRSGRTDADSAPHIPERTCILSREQGPREGLIRLAVSPGGEVLPDVRAKAPGRGAWIGVDRAALEAAQAKGRLKAVLSRAFKTGEIAIPDDLGARIEAALRQAALDRLGLEARSGFLITGSEKIETAARKGEVEMLIHAADASADGNRKLDQALRVGDEGGGGPAQGLVFPEDRTILSLALGRQNVVHVAIIDRAAAARVAHAIDRWRTFIGPDAGLSTAATDARNAAAVEVNEG